jgi:hypothetical protein
LARRNILKGIEGRWPSCQVQPQTVPQQPRSAAARKALSPATLDEHEADTFGEHEFVNVLSPWPSIGGAVMVELSR